MKFANATHLNRKSGGAKPRDLGFRGPLLETRNDKGEVGVFHEDSAMSGGGCGRLERGTRMAHRRSLGFPGFPVESCGFGRLRVVLFEENHIRVADESSAAGNPGSSG